jgi:hypothetical protein
MFRMPLLYVSLSIRFFALLFSYLRTRFRYDLSVDCRFRRGETTSLNCCHWRTDDIWVCRSTVELYWQGKTEELGEKPVPMSICQPQIPFGQTRGANPDLCGERPETNRLNHGAALFQPEISKQTGEPIDHWRTSVHDNLKYNFLYCANLETFSLYSEATWISRQQNQIPTSADGDTRRRDSINARIYATVKRDEV